MITAERRASSATKYAYTTSKIGDREDTPIQSLLIAIDGCTTDITVVPCSSAEDGGNVPVANYIYGSRLVSIHSRKLNKLGVLTIGCVTVAGKTRRVVGEDQWKN
ncbi:hypothetical protein V2J09_006229 [Rumex salicifolius]